MIDMEKVIRAVDSCFNYWLEKHRCLNPLELENVRQFKADAISLLKEQEWHMLTEDDDGIIHGLPGDDGQYLMSDGKEIWIDEYVDGVADGIFLDSGRDIREIKAWKYMPELPKTDRR